MILRAVSVLVLCFGLHGMSASEPLVLDLKKHYTKSFDPLKERLFKPIMGAQTIDGLPFRIDGEMPLFGRTPAERKKVHPKSYTGIVIGRAFEELHLIHMTHWVDVEGRQISTVTLHYEDGSKHAFPIAYGVHVRDQSHLLSEEKELITDPATKIFWRGPGDEQLKSTLRLFKTTLVNPHPQKTVTTMDLEAAPDCLASHALMAATVSDHDDKRPVSPAPAPDGPERTFDGVINVAVLDHETKLPLVGALVQFGFVVDEVYLVSSPALTDSRGMATVKYPAGRTTYIRLDADMEGMQQGTATWSVPDSFLKDYVFQLEVK